MQLAGVDTVLTADTVEWCTTPGLEGLLACGTYQLNQQEATRIGSLTLYLWDGEKLIRTLEKEMKVFSFGILDMKWNTKDNDSFLAMATANGSVHFVQLQQVGNDLNVRDLGSAMTVREQEAKEGDLHIALSLDWGQHNNVAVSDTLGQVGVVSLGEAGPQLQEVWKAHEYEAWITCFGHSEETVYSGGDDCRLKGWDLRMGTAHPSFTCKWHSMGVCSLQMHPGAGSEHILASGSYDENIALWDVRKMTTPLKEVSVGGGVWRLKWNPALPDLLAAACMHNHFCILSTHLDSAHPVEVVGVYKKHSSLAYGIDWCRRYEKLNQDSSEAESCRSRRFTLASCSFYDHSMHLWNFSLPQN